jgi:hypothetical protein
VFVAADAPLRACIWTRQDMEIAPDDLNNTRLELERLAERSIRGETE